MLTASVVAGYWQKCQSAAVNSVFRTFSC